MRPTRLMFVLPLVAAAAFVAVLNGNVLCMAGAGHVAVEAPHDAGGCAAAGECEGHGERESHGGGCSDVSADLDLLKAGSRSSVDTDAPAVPSPLAAVAPVAASAALAGLPLVHSTSPPLSTRQSASLETVVLII